MESLKSQASNHKFQVSEIILLTLSSLFPAPFLFAATDHGPLTMDKTSFLVFSPCSMPYAISIRNPQSSINLIVDFIEVKVNERQDPGGNHA